ncbi:hypothetical protein JX265_008000 [Neoarthrinium moseri]|uniref:Rhodopsin domain-containing protein n=1 Tax=Neoarthrinium moseri TaxID=1658444 RepID=A0A9Q0ANY5_9PEZI|nr:uncharacterized protein JN550_004554 [Neoarthrinium moseri]KAI1849664.1 hypothetical protein JX266_004613 [Neoarthrinium moseri]KAI1865677.1 hypothetical protein JX265_008000 [Neoarthrinium moseri]KAI1871560.1 hypothetical protein JN550_004554 [Neoarthrinium moseri]
MSLPAFDFSQTTDYQGFVLRDLNIWLIVFSTIIVFCRLYVRAFMTKGLGLDDLVTVVTYLLLVIWAGLDIRLVTFGAGAHQDQIPEEFIVPYFSALTTQQLLYFWCVGLMRLAIVAFLLRLAKDRLFKILTYTTGGVILLQTVGCFLFRLLECKNISDLFQPPGATGDCIAKQTEAYVMWAHSSIGIVIDLALFFLPIWIVRSKMMHTAKAIRVVLIFLVGIFVLATGIVRLAIIVSTDFSKDTTYKISVLLWTDLEAHVGLWCACFPSLQPLVRLLSYKCGLRSKLESSNQYPGKTSGARTGYARSGNHGVSVTTSGFHGRSKNGYLRNGSGFDGTSDNMSDSNSQRGIVAEARGGEGIEMNEFDDLPKQGAITRRTEVRIDIGDKV